MSNQQKLDAVLGCLESEGTIADVAQRLYAKGIDMHDGSVYLALRRLVLDGKVTRGETLVNSGGKPRVVGLYAVNRKRLVV